MSTYDKPLYSQIFMVKKQRTTTNTTVVILSPVQKQVRANYGITTLGLSVGKGELDCFKNQKCSNST